MRLKKKDENTKDTSLSMRELELLSLLHKGYCFKHAASYMGVKVNTTKTFASRAYKKLGVNNLQSALYELKSLNLI